MKSWVIKLKVLAILSTWDNYFAKYTYCCGIFISITNYVVFFSSLNNLIIFPKHAFSHSNNYWWKEQREWGYFYDARPVEQCYITHRQPYRVILTQSKRWCFWRIKGKFVKRLSAIASSKLTNILSL